VRNHSYENVFRLQVHFYANQTHFRMKSFAQGLILKQRHKVNSDMAYSVSESEIFLK